MLRLGIVAALLVIAAVPVVSQDRGNTQSHKLTAGEIKEAQQLALQVTERLVANRDFGAVADEFFVRGFHERYVNQNASEHTPANSTETYFLPGLYYHSSLLEVASADDWKRFYLAASNFLLRGVFISLNRSATALLKGKKPSEKILNKLYPRDVVKLFDNDPILRNFIERKDKITSIQTVAELQRVTALLEQGTAIIDQADHRREYLLTDDARKVIEILGQGGPLRHSAYTSTGPSFGFPAGTRFIHIVTPLTFELTVASDNGTLKVLWAEPYTGN